MKLSVFNKHIFFNATLDYSAKFSVFPCSKKLTENKKRITETKPENGMYKKKMRS